MLIKFFRAIYNGYNAIRAGEAKVIIAGGQENMTLAEHSIHLRQGKRFGNAELKDTVLTDGLTDAFLEMHMGLTGILFISNENFFYSFFLRS